MKVRPAALVCAERMSFAGSAFSAHYSRALGKTQNGQHARVAPATPADPGITSRMNNSLAASLSVDRPAHIRPTGEPHAPGSHNIHERTLALRAYRQELLASNIANADTPGYKAVDIDIARALRNGQS